MNKIRCMHETRVEHAPNCSVTGLAPILDTFISHRCSSLEVGSVRPCELWQSQAVLNSTFSQVNSKHTHTAIHKHVNLHLHGN